MKQRVEKSANLHWIAEYADGSTLTESDVGYGNLKRDGLTAFGLFTEIDKPVALLELSPEKTLFYRMRVILDISGNGSERIYMMGFRKRDGLLNLTVVDASGKSFNYNSFRAAKLDEIEYYPQEQV
jgi:hypothetical protein